MNFLIKIMKRLCFAFVCLYGINIIFESLNIMIPINILTLAIVAFLGLPGIGSLFVIYLMIF